MGFRKLVDSMSLDKAIAHKKEKRKPYSGSKSIDPNCRNHGSCSWCEGNRKYHDNKEEERCEQEMEEYYSKEEVD